jgi:hypothetical protein
MPNMVVAGQVGPQQAAGAGVAFRQELSGALVVQELNGRYYEQASRGGLFTARASAVALSTAAAAMVGLILWNPGPKNLALLKASGSIFVTSATATGIVLAVSSAPAQVSAPTGQTAISRVGNNLIGGAPPQGQAMNAGTLVAAPVAAWDLLHNTAAIAVTGEDPGFQMDFEGAIVLPANTVACFAALGAAVAAGGANLSLMWQEI